MASKREMLKKIDASTAMPLQRGFPKGLPARVDSSTAESLAVRRSRGATGHLQGPQINGSYSTNLELFQYPTFCLTEGPAECERSHWHCPQWELSQSSPLLTLKSYWLITLTHWAFPKWLCSFLEFCCSAQDALASYPAWPSYSLEWVNSSPTKAWPQSLWVCHYDRFTCCGNYWSGFLFQWTVRPSVLGLCSYFVVPGHTHMVTLSKFVEWVKEKY